MYETVLQSRFYQQHARLIFTAVNDLPFSFVSYIGEEGKHSVRTHEWGAEKDHETGVI